MGRERQDITEAEMGVLQVLWDRGAASIRQITDVLYENRAEAAQYATVQKQLERLEAKGFVRRDRSLFVHVFTAAVNRDELIGRRLRDMAEKLCGGSLAPILSHLARTRALSDAERKALRDLVNAPDPDTIERDVAQGDRRGKRKGKG
jgi:predicted transcriptional regulator